MGLWLWPSRSAIALCLVAVVGCGSQQRAEPSGNEVASIEALIEVYRDHVRTNQDPPANEAKLREFIAANDSAVLERRGIDDVDQLFVSPRTGDPLVIVYGRQGPTGDRREPYIAYESTPVDGRRWVANMRGAIDEMDDASLRELFPDAR